MLTFYKLNLVGEYNSDHIEILFLPVLVLCQSSKLIPLAIKPPYTHEAISKCPETSNTICSFLKFLLSLQNLYWKFILHLGHHLDNTID